MRVIYYYLTVQQQLRLILIYRKGPKDDLSEDEKKVLRDLNQGWK